MEYNNTILRNFLDILASDSPVPGGGGVAAMGGAMAAALGEMVINISVKHQMDPNEQKIFLESLIELNEIRIEDTISIDDDANNFLDLLESFRLKKDTVEEKQKRIETIAINSLIAANTPLQVLGTSVLILEILETILPFVSSSLVTDIGVAAQFALASLNSSYMNILINKPKIKDKHFLEVLENTLPFLLESGRKTAQSITDTVIEQIS